MMRNDVGAEPVEDAIIKSAVPRLNRLSLMRFLRTAKTTSAPFREMIDHLRDDGHVVLQIRVKRDHRIGFADLSEQTSQQRVLMPTLRDNLSPRTRFGCACEIFSMRPRFDPCCRRRPAGHNSSAKSFWIFPAC